MNRVSFEDLRGSSDDGEDDEAEAEMAEEDEDEEIQPTQEANVIETEEQAELIDLEGRYNSEEHETCQVLLPGTPVCMMKPAALASPSPHVLLNTYVFSPSEEERRLSSVQEESTPSQRSGSPFVALMKSRFEAKRSTLGSTSAGIPAGSPTPHIILERCDSPPKNSTPEVGMPDGTPTAKVIVRRCDSAAFLGTPSSTVSRIFYNFIH